MTQKDMPLDNCLWCDKQIQDLNYINYSENYTKYTDSGDLKSVATFEFVHKDCLENPKDKLGEYINSFSIINMHYTTNKSLEKIQTTLIAFYLDKDTDPSKILFHDLNEPFESCEAVAETLTRILKENSADDLLDILEIDYHWASQIVCNGMSFNIDKFEIEGELVSE